MQSVPPIVKDLVLVGGGHTHAIVLRKFGMQPLLGVRLTLISDVVHTPYSGMLPGHIAGQYTFDESHIDLEPLTHFAQAQLVRDRAVGIDPIGQQVLCAQHPPIAYDVLSLDIGSTPARLNVPGAAKHVIPAKPVPALLRAWAEWLEAVQAAAPSQTMAIAVVGGGVGGVELILNMQRKLWDLLDALGRPRGQVALHLFHRGSMVAKGRNRCTRRWLQQHLMARGIHLHLSESVCAVEAIAPERHRLRCESGLTVECDRIFWVTQAAAPDWLRASGLATDERGFVLVENTLQSCSHHQVFAAGDVATMQHQPRPKAGVFAVRQGNPLFHNLRAALQSQPLRPFRPQTQYLSLISTGDGSAVAARGPWMFAAPLMQTWKDRIDRQFMAQFAQLPPMSSSHDPQTPPAAFGQLTDPPAPYCAGCGSKVGRDVLTRALERVRVAYPTAIDWPHADTIVVGLEAPDDAAIVRVPQGFLAAQTVDFFRALVSDPFVFGQICVKHCLSDLYAMGADPQSVLAIATVPYAVPAKQEETLFQLLAGVQAALTLAKTPLVGGHTTTGPELALGLACNGLVAAAQLLRKGGMQPGQTLILTQPLGTGTLFAAQMQRQAKGRWIETAIAAMIQPSAAAAHCLQQHGATACTDVTGFGLIGHLLEMAVASKVAVNLNLQSLPILPGARETLAQGWVSSLQAQNLQAAAAIGNGDRYGSRPDYGILFDPQTAGGLLASLPTNRARTCLEALHALGYTAAVALGTVEPLTGTGPPLTIKQW